MAKVDISTDITVVKNRDLTTFQVVDEGKRVLLIILAMGGSYGSVLKDKDGDVTGSYESESVYVKEFGNRSCIVDTLTGMTIIEDGDLTTFQVVDK